MSFLRFLIKKRDFEERINISKSYFSLFIMGNFKCILKKKKKTEYNEPRHVAITKPFLLIYLHVLFSLPRDCWEEGETPLPSSAHRQNRQSQAGVSCPES